MSPRPTPARAPAARAASLVVALAGSLLTGFHDAAHHSVHPTPLCDFGCGPSELASAVVDTQGKLEAAGSNLVVAMAIWDQVEACVPEGAPLPATAVDVRSKACFFDAAGVGYEATGRPCLCYYDLTTLEQYLDAFVGAPAATGGLGVDALIQLAPIFTGFRRVPPYLWKTVFSDAAMLNAFEGLWNHVSVVLGKPKYAGRSFLISLGNEVNLYLNTPNGLPAGRNELANENTTKIAWTAYRTFYAGASAYVRDGGASNFTRVTGVTLTWYACGGGLSLVEGSPDPSCGQIPPGYLDPPEVFQNAWVTDLLAEGDALVFTMYPNLVGKTDDDIRAEFSLQVLAMGMLGFQSTPRKAVFLQEVGHPSSSGTPADGALAREQATMVEALFDAVSQRNAFFRTYADGFTPIQGFSLFQLHDFQPSVVDRFFDCSVEACPSGFTCEHTPAGDGRWYLRDAVSEPGARQEADLVYDPVRGRVVLFGGVEVPPDTPGAIGYTDVWVATLPPHPSTPPAPWRKLATSGGPPAGNGAESVWVSSRDRVLVVSPNATTGLTEFWALEQVGASGGAWTRLQPTGPAVSLRPFGRAAYDPVADRVLYFGGRAGGTTSSNELVILDLTQGADGAVTVAPHPTIPGREEFGFAFDEGANRVVLYGGSGEGARLDDAWELSFATSSLGVAAPLTQPGPTPGPRTFASWANDAAGRRALLFGGLVGAGVPGALAQDVWVADYSSPGVLGWTELSPASAAAGEPTPRGRVGAAAAFLPVGDRILVHGGISDLAYTPLADTWELQFAEAHRCRLTSPSCSDDADCDAVGATVGVQPGIFKCCLGAAMCSPAQLGTCVLPSTCDLAVHQLFPATPCPDGTATGCGAGEICSSAHLCVPPAHRSHVCSWGLVDATGAAKPSWEALVSSAESFVP